MADTAVLEVAPPQQLSGPGEEAEEIKPVSPSEIHGTSGPNDDELDSTRSQPASESRNAGEFDGQGPPNFDTPYDKPSRPARAHDAFPHRHYTSLHPVCNKLLAMKWDIHQRDQHANKILSMKSQLYSKETHKIPKNLKKIQLEKDRQRDIQRQNRIAEERIKYLLKSHGPTGKGMEHNRPIIMRKHINAVQIQSNERIRRENQAMLARLEQKKPQYNSVRWMEDRLIQLRYLQNISSFPQKFINLRKELEEKLALARKQIDSRRHAAPAQQPASPKKRSPPPNDKAARKPVKVVEKIGSGKKVPKISENVENAKIPREDSPIENTSKPEEEEEAQSDAPAQAEEPASEAAAADGAVGTYPDTLAKFEQGVDKKEEE